MIRIRIRILILVYSYRHGALGACQGARGRGAVPGGARGGRQREAAHAGVPRGAARAGAVGQREALLRAVHPAALRGQLGLRLLGDRRRGRRRVGVSVDARALRRAADAQPAASRRRREARPRRCPESVAELQVLTSTAGGAFCSHLLVPSSFFIQSLLMSLSTLTIRNHTSISALPLCRPFSLIPSRPSNFVYLFSFNFLFSLFHLFLHLKSIKSN